MIRWDWLESLVAEKEAEWNRGGTTRYFVIDDLLEDGVCEKLADFSSIEGKFKGTLRKSHKHVRGKSGSGDRSRMTDLQRQFFDEVNSERFISYLERITGISPIYADPNLNGGGLHQIRTGGYLNVHTDFNFDPETRRNRRLNLLLYLNKEWKDEWAGNIELWDETLTKPYFSAAPIQNRVLVFETTEESFHGHPVPLQTPPGVLRKSMAVYYYSDWPEGLAYRKHTGYQLTRRQWAEMIGRIAAIVSKEDADEEAVVKAMETDYQTGDIRTGFRTLMGLRSGLTTGESVWEKPDGSVTVEEPR